jgi:hypothetical protein
MAALIVGIGGAALASGLMYSAYNVAKFTIRTVKSHMLHVDKNTVLIYIVAYDAFHATINLFDGEVYVEFDWNCNENHEEGCAAIIMRRYSKEQSVFPVAWLVHAVTELRGVDIDDIADLIKRQILSDEQFNYPAYCIRSCNCRSFCDKIISIIEDYLKQSLVAMTRTSAESGVDAEGSASGECNGAEGDEMEVVVLPRCAEFGLVIGSGNITDALSTLHTKLLLLGKVVGGTQRVRIQNYQVGAEVLRQFCYKMAN